MSIDNKEKNFISVIIYVYNNADALQEFLPILYGTLDNNFEKYEIICVNDATEDAGIEKVKEFSLSCENPNISIVNMGIYQGTELSMNAGTDIAIGDFVFQFDNLQLNYTEDLIMSIYHKSLEGNDIVMAVPRDTVGISSKICYKIFNANSAGQSYIMQDVCHIISRRAINRVEALNKSITYRKATYNSCGLKCAHVVFDNKLLKRREFNKKIKKVRQETAFESLVLYTDTIQKISAWITTAFLAFVCAVGVYAFVTRFSSHKPIEGWTFTILYMSIAFFGVFLILTIMLKYMSVLLSIEFKKQNYLVDSIEKITNN